MGGPSSPVYTYVSISSPTYPLTRFLHALFSISDLGTRMYMNSDVLGFIIC